MIVACRSISNSRSILHTPCTILLAESLDDIVVIGVTCHLDTSTTRCEVCAHTTGYLTTNGGIIRATDHIPNKEIITTFNRGRAQNSDEEGEKQEGKLADHLAIILTDSATESSRIGNRLSGSKGRGEWK